MKKTLNLRFVLLLLSLGLLGTEGLISLPRQEGGQDPFRNGFTTAEIKPYNGAPTLFLNGKPAFYGTWWTSPPTVDGWTAADVAKKNAAETGIHIYAFDIGSTEWCGPGPGRPSHYDFSTVKARFNQVLAADPNALFHLRIYLEMAEGQSQWWHDMYPEEREIVSDGTPHRQSYASKLWREQAKAFLRAFVAYLKQVDLFKRVVSYQVGTGHTGEWVKGKLSMFFLTGDYSKPMAQHFRSWLRQKYNNDPAVFQRAWNKQGTSFENAEVPTAAEQFEAKHMTFRDPQTEQNVIDYYQCLAELCGDLVVDFCTTVKEATAGKALAGAFYGYLMELAWNAGFFAEGPGSPYSSYQRSGHLGLGRVLESPQVNFLVSPYSYGFRGMGGEGVSMLPTESVRLHNKMYLMEDDSRTHTDADPAYGRARNLDEATALLRRNFGTIATHGQGIWWLAHKGHIEPNLEPAFKPMLKEFAKLGAFALETDRTPGAEIAVFLDDESFFYETVKNELDVPLIFHQRLVGLPRLGAPFDLYLLNDFLKGSLPPYKLYVFLNAFRLDETRRAALKKELCKDGRTALWIYAPGYIKDDASVENMRELTGISFVRNEHPWPSFLHITDFRHPITSRLPQDLFWDNQSHVGPQFHVADKEARVLGEAVFAQGTCQPGFVIKEFPAWKSIYVAVPNIPARVLREIARFANVHLYNEEGDVLAVSRNLLSVHTMSGGKRTFRLPATAEVVFDLFDRKVVATAANEFEVSLPPASTSLYFTGKKSLLDRLAK
jgi:hypothetical protein